MADKTDIQYPKNLNLEGVLSFPLTSSQDLLDVVDWRVKKGHAKPQYEDKIGGTLFLDQENYDKAVRYLTEIALPFSDKLWAQTNGKKGIDPELTADLLKQAQERVWIDPTDKKKRPNMPLRNLSESDIENMGDFQGVAKIKFAGPYQADMGKKALIHEDGQAMVVKLEDLEGDLALPDLAKDYDKLWWGAGWHFRTGLRFNVFDKASVGVTAYNQTLYLLPEMGMPISGNNGDATILDDGDDWE
jgi:hypothetical protein